MPEVTQILTALEGGKNIAAEELLPLVYGELRRLAAWHLANERPGQTLQATALVHEAYLRLVGKEDPHWSGQRHFFGAAAEAMRRILVENARRKKRLKRGGDLERVELEEADIPAPLPDDELLALDEALDRLVIVDSRAAELVKLCFFVGLTQKHNFDQVLLAETSAWFGGKSRAEIFRQAATVALNRQPKRWGDVRRFTMTNIFFNGRLPRWLGFDRGPFVATGGRATIHQAQLYTSSGRCTSFLPSFRIVSDLATDESFSNIAGGPSDRRFSRWYGSEVEHWLAGKYKRLAA